jgi:predicted membrane metal-binding protein
MRRQLRSSAFETSSLRGCPVPQASAAAIFAKFALAPIALLLILLALSYGVMLAALAGQLKGRPTVAARRSAVAEVGDG